MLRSRGVFMRIRTGIEWKRYFHEDMKTVEMSRDAVADAFEDVDDTIDMHILNRATLELNREEVACESPSTALRPHRKPRA